VIISEMNFQCKCASEHLTLDVLNLLMVTEKAFFHKWVVILGLWVPLYNPSF